MIIDLSQCQCQLLHCNWKEYKLWVNIKSYIMLNEPGVKEIGQFWKRIDYKLPWHMLDSSCGFLLLES